VIAVDEIDACSLGDVAQDRRIAAAGELVPTHMGDLQAEFFIDIEADAFAGDDAQGLVFAILVTDIEKHLQTQADSQEELALLDVGNDRLGEVFFAKRGDGILQGPYSRQDELIRPGDLLGLGDDFGGFPNLFKCLLHRAQVGHSVVDNRDRHGGIVHIADCQLNGLPIANCRLKYGESRVAGPSIGNWPSAMSLKFDYL
jgi:hypothetical protein